MSAAGCFGFLTLAQMAAAVSGGAVAVKLHVSAENIFKQRFGRVGEELASVLHIFSLDVVGVVASYAVCGIAKPEQSPVFLFGIGSAAFDFLSSSQQPFKETVYTIACHKPTRTIWIGDDNTAQVFSDTQDLLFRVAGIDGPGGFAFDNDGDVFISDYDRHRIAVYSWRPGLQPTFTRSFGSKGTDQGFFDGPWGVALSSARSDAKQTRTTADAKTASVSSSAPSVADSLVYVVDRANSRVQVFSKQGELVRVFGGSGHDDLQLYGPSGIAIDSQGDVFVVDQLNHCVKVFKPHAEECKFIRKFGGDELKSPVSIAFDDEHNIFVTNRNMHSVSVFKHNGELMTSFGAYGSNDGQFVYPRGLCVDVEGQIWVGDQQARVQVFAFLA